MTTKQRLIQRIKHLPDDLPIFRKMLNELEAIEQVNMKDWSKELDDIMGELPETSGFKPFSREEIYKDV